MPGETSKAARNHHDGQNQEGSKSPKDKGMEENKSRQAPKTPQVAVTTRRQLCTLDRGTTIRKMEIQLSKAPTIDTSLEKEAQKEEKTNDPTAKATLDKDATERGVSN